MYHSDSGQAKNTVWKMDSWWFDPLHVAEMSQWCYTNGHFDFFFFIFKTSYQLPYLIISLSSLFQYVPRVEPEVARRSLRSLHQPAERLPHNQGGPEALQDPRGGGEGEGGHR